MDEQQKTSVQTAFLKGPMKILSALLMLMVIFALGAYAQNTFKKASESSFGPAMISVNGTGEVLAVPDIANFTFSVRAEGETADEAQEASAVSMNSIIEFLKSEGVEEKDIKTTNYNLNQQYRYEERVCPEFGYCPPGERILDGYQVSQSVAVKVRDTEQSGSLITGVGERGATDISSLYFTIDDEDALKDEARTKAIANAKQKAVELAEDLGVRIVRINSYYEDQPGPMYGYGGMEMSAMDMSDSAMKVSPSIPTGEDKITSRVTISFEIK